MKSITIKTLLAAALLLPFAANAAPIDGNIGIVGALVPTCTAGPPCTMDIANGLDFTPNTGIVVFATGDFAVTPFVTTANMTDFTFAPFSAVTPLWEIPGLWDFDLETLNIVGQTATSLELRGTGTIHDLSTGLDDTFGVWSFSADAASGLITFSWSSTTLAPEPGILFLMGMGLIGGLGARRLTRS